MNRIRSDELDEHLQKLAISAQQHPPLTQARQVALNKLVNGILQSGRLCRPQRGQFSGVYDDIYNEAVQELLLFVCQNISRYNPERGAVMTWVNMLLERRYFREAIPRILDQPNLEKTTLPDLENVAIPAKEPTLTEIIAVGINDDPDNLVKSAHIRNHPEVTFQILALKRLADLSWKDISTEFDISIQTLSSFYYRCLDKFSSKLKEYCAE